MPINSTGTMPANIPRKSEMRPYCAQRIGEVELHEIQAERAGGKQCVEIAYAADDKATYGFKALKACVPLYAPCRPLERSNRLWPIGRQEPVLSPKNAAFKCKISRKKSRKPPGVDVVQNFSRIMEKIQARLAVFS